MDRAPCCEKQVGLKKGPWTLEEDQKLVAYVEVHGHGSWRAVPEKAGLQRCGKSCRLRWTNYLRPDIKRGKFSLQEEQTIIHLHALLGNRWSAIATHLPKRTDNEIKNYWNTHLKKRLANTGIDPVTHKPKSGTLSSGNGQTKIAASLAHMAQWESARLEAEARLARESKLRAPSNSVPFQAENQLGSPPPPPFLDVLRACQGLWPKPASGNLGANFGLQLPTSSLSSSQDMSIGLNDNSEIPMPTLKTMSTMLLDGKAPCIKSWSSEGSGFTDMLLSNSDTQNSLGRVGDTENGEEDSFLEWDDNEEGSKNYWNSLLDFVSS